VIGLLITFAISRYSSVHASLFEAGSHSVAIVKL
jgi:hypothetical protein